MIDAKFGFMKDGAKNRLREQDIRRIVDVWQTQRDVPHFARFVPMEEIERNDYNLNIPRYISAPDTEILQDIDAHLHGGLPAHDIEQLSDYWLVCPSLREDLFRPHVSRTGYFTLKCESSACTIQLWPTPISVIRPKFLSKLYRMVRSTPCKPLRPCYGVCAETSYRRIERFATHYFQAG